MAVRKRYSRKKKRSGAARFLLTVFLLALMAASAGAWLILAPFGPSTETIVDVATGSSAGRIGQQLETAGILRTHFAFDAVRIWKRGKLRAGEYRFDHPASPMEVYA